MSLLKSYTCLVSSFNSLRSLLNSFIKKLATVTGLIVLSSKAPSKSCSVVKSFYKYRV